MRGRYRRCASQQGNALWYLTVLGLADHRADALVERLRHWQWPDGGWNCDWSPEAAVSSVTETWLPLRGLGAYAQATGDAAAQAAAGRAAEFLLSRRIVFRRTDKRCADAIDLLEAKRLPDGGWPAEKRYYRASAHIGLGNDFVDWGGTSMRRHNEWVTADVLGVLRAAGRLELKRE